MNADRLPLLSPPGRFADDDDPRPPGQRSPEDEERLDRLLAGLNEPQRVAVTHGDGPLLILAGAGSGKTRVLTRRIAWLMFTDRAAPGEILSITFTNKAAQEMRDRVEQLVGRRTRGMWLLTFHSACARMLRADGDRLGYTRQYTIYDQADARRLIKRCLDELGIDTKRFTPAAIHHQISAAKNQLRGAAAYRELVGSYFEQTVADVFERYERDLHRMNAMDFDDLLLRAVDLLELFPEVRERYARAFRHVLVDEYQDTNRAQYRWLQLLVGGGREAPREGERVAAGGHRNLAVVGDDCQSIYSFRQADVRNILDFQDDFPDAFVVTLEQNYRSTQTILAAANAVIAHNRDQMTKRLWSDLGDGERVRVRELEDEHAEARFVAGEIERLVDEGASRAEIAVFYRVNALSRVLEDTLVRREIAYQVIGGTKFYERAEIKDAIAYLAFLANPQDVVSFTRVVNSPRRGIGQTSLARVLAHAETMGIAVWDAAAVPTEVPGLGAAAVKAIGRFMDTLAGLRAKLAGGGPVADLLEAVLGQTGYVEALEAERTIEAEGRIENLRELVGVAGEFDAAAAAEPGLSTLDVFLQQIALVADADDREDEEHLVTLMTLHNAKGLEYPIVFIVGCEDGLFPHSRSLDDGTLEEERRLCYVGLTRAMRQLTLTHVRRRMVFGAAHGGGRSRFIDEIPRELTDREEHEPPALGGTRGGGGRLGGGWGGGLGGGSGGGLLAGLPGGAAGRPGGEWGSREGPPVVAYRLGEDVVHAAFGEGVVTGVEPGGVIVVRFAGDHSERKLVAEIAPISRR